MLSDDEITFVMQGNICDSTKTGIASIRSFFPNARIVLSTTDQGIRREDWEDVADLVVSDDPGYGYYEPDIPNGKKNNVNRQIVSTLAGLKAVKTKYTFKLRTDFTITGRGFIDFFDRYPGVDKDYALLQRKLLACQCFSRNPLSNDTMPFHISDVAFFGLTEDIVTLYDIPLMRNDDYVVLNGRRVTRYAPEQYIFSNFLWKNNHDVIFAHMLDNTVENIAATERYFTSNFIILDFKRFCLATANSHFDLHLNAPGFSTCYTHREWLALYSKYVDQTVTEGVDADSQRMRINVACANFRKNKRIANILSVPIFHKPWRLAVRKAVMQWLARG